MTIESIGEIEMVEITKFFRAIEFNRDLHVYRKALSFLISICPRTICQVVEGGGKTIINNSMLLQQEVIKFNNMLFQN